MKYYISSTLFLILFLSCKQRQIEGTWKVIIIDSNWVIESGSWKPADSSWVVEKVIVLHNNSFSGIGKDSAIAGNYSTKGDSVILEIDEKFETFKGILLNDTMMKGTNYSYYEVEHQPFTFESPWTAIKLK